MTTGYTQPELVEMEKVMIDHAPPIPTAADRKTSPMVTALAWNGSYTGMLLLLQFPAEQQLVMHLNCVVALELMECINITAHEQRWWAFDMPGAADNDRPLIFSTENNSDVLVVSTVVTGYIDEGVMVRFGDTQGGIVSAFMPRSVARGLVVSIATMGAAADWWDSDYNLKPAQMVDDTVVMRAANQLIKRYGDSAEMQAALRSNAADHDNDLFNYQLWQRVGFAVAQLQRTKPTNPKDIN